MEGFSREKLKRIRLRLGLSQRAVPGVAQDTLSALESGRREPRPSTLRRLAEAYGVEVADFFEDPVTRPKAALPADFDIDEIIREVIEAEQPETRAELDRLVDERIVSKLEHLPRETLEAIEVDLRQRSARLDKSFNSPVMRDPEEYNRMVKLMEEIRAVRLTLIALDRVLTEA